MKQITRDGEDITAVELEIDTRDIFSDDFKHYAKMLYLMMLHRSAEPDRSVVVDNDEEIVSPAKDSEDIANKIVREFVKATSDAVILLMHDLTHELADPEKLNEALTELFGNRWDSEHRCFRDEAGE